MSGSAIDPERIAALIDGRLGERERAELLARLAASPDDELEAVADAVAVTRELEGGGDAARDALGAPTTRGRSWRRRPRSWLAFAAVAVGVVLAPSVWWLTRDRARPRDPGRFALALTHADLGLPANWQDQPWGATRGTADAPIARAQAVRIGARITDLELAARTRDNRIAEMASEVAALLGDIPAGGPAAARYRAIAAEAATAPDRLMELTARARLGVAPLLHQEYLALGAWLEAARLAAARGDSAFFRSRPSREVLQRVSRDRTITSSVRDALDSVPAMVDARNWSGLDRGMTDALALLGR